MEPLPHRGVEDLIARGQILSDYRNNRRSGLLIGSEPIEASHRILNPTHEATSLESLPRPRCHRPGGVRGDDTARDGPTAPAQHPLDHRRRHVGHQNPVTEIRDVEKLHPTDGLIYAGAQKNMGIAGLTVVIVREDLLGRARPGTPAMLDYQVHAEADSLACTAPTFAWYLAALVLDWIEGQGGLEHMAVINKRKADKLYACIDSSNFYHNPIESDCRSWMNIPFTLPSDDLDEVFLRESAEQGMVGLKGHRFVGGMRASIYNAMPEEGVDQLVTFMSSFMQRHG